MYYIRTASMDAKKIYEAISGSVSNDEIVYVDRNVNLWDKKIDNLLIISIYEFLRDYKKGDTVIVPANYYNREIETELQYGNVSNEDIKIYCEGRFYGINDFTYLDYLEFHTNDHCNLNCKGCSHFCPLVKEEVFTDYEQFCEDLSCLKQLIVSVKKIRIMGGEPLLNDKLDKFVSTTREFYPEADIRIVTNAFLINSLSEKMWNIFREKKVKIDISVYPPMKKKMDLIIKEINRQDVMLGDLNNVSYFTPIMHERRPLTFDNTTSCICNNLYNGQIASCPMVFYGKYFNEYFKTNIPFETGSIDLHRVRDGRQLMEMLNQPFAFCEYCNEYMFGINPSVNISEWESKNGTIDYKISDWCEGKIE